LELTHVGIWRLLAPRAEAVFASILSRLHSLSFEAFKSQKYLGGYFADLTSSVATVIPPLKRRVIRPWNGSSPFMR
jgi:hypothetical protein